MRVCVYDIGYDCVWVRFYGLKRTICKPKIERLQRTQKHVTIIEPYKEVIIFQYVFGEHATIAVSKNVNK